MDLESLFQTSEDRYRVFHCRLVYQHLLETTFQCGVFFYIFPVFIECSRAYAVQLSSRKFRLEQVAGVHCALCLASTDDIVYLVYEEDYPSLGFLDLIEHSLESFFELASELCTCDQRSHIQCKYRLVFQAFRHVSVQDPLCQSFYDSRLADARFSDQHRIVLSPSGKDLNRMSDLAVTADHRIELAFSCHLYEVSAVLVQRIVVFLRILACHSLVAAHFVERIQEFFLIDAVSLENRS